MHQQDIGIALLADGNRLPGADGIEATRQIKAACPRVRVLILTADATPARLAAAAAAGASGFLAKDSPFPDILAAIRAPIDGKILVEGNTLEALIKSPDRASPPSGQTRLPVPPSTRWLLRAPSAASFRSGSKPGTIAPFSTGTGVPQL